MTCTLEECSKEIAGEPFLWHGFPYCSASCKQLERELVSMEIETIRRNGWPDKSAAKSVTQ